MFLGNTLNSASTGLDSIQRQIAIVSQNVANASTPNYVRESTPLSSVDNGAGGPGGVRTGQAVREIDVQLQANLFASVANEAGSNVTQNALNAIDQASGTPGSGQDLASLVGGLQDSLTALTPNPADTTQQSFVVDKAQSLVDGLHSLSGTLAQTRQKAQEALQDGVTTANAALSTIGKLSDQIIAAKAAGQSTAGLEDNRDGQLKTLAQLTGAKFVNQPNGDVQVIAANTVLSTHANTGPFGIAPSVNLPPGQSGPGLTMNGNPVPSLGGEIGANLTLRDETIPKMQAGLDIFAQSIASGFANNDVKMFSDATGNVPSAAVGFATTIQIAPGFTPDGLRQEPGATRAAGDTTLIENVLSTVFQPGSNGAATQATDLVAGFARQATQAGTTATANASLRTGLESRLASTSGVSVDSELAHMVQLQTAYAANAKVLTAVQSMWSQLLEVIR